MAKWLTPKEAGADPRIDVSAVTIVRAIRRGELRATAPRGRGQGKRRRYRVDPASLEAWIAAAQRAAAS